VFAEIVFPDLEGRSFTYSIKPGKEEKQAIRGARVLVPFRKGVKTGYILDLKEKPPRGITTIKPVMRIIHPVIPDRLFRLALWMADYYFVSMGKMLHSVYPAPARLGHNEIILPGLLFSMAPQLLKNLVPEKGITKRALLEKGNYQEREIDGFIEKGLIQRRVLVQDGKSKERVIVYTGPETTSPEISARALRQREIVDRLLAVGGSLPLKEFGRSSAVKALEAKGLVAVREVSASRGEKKQLLFSPFLKALTSEQERVYQDVRKTLDKGFSVHLIHGITGSGKTELYLHLMKDVLKKGRDVLYLVPEVALTAHLTHRLEAALGERVNVLHSYMGRRERYEAWNRAFSSAGEVFIGPRSALFTPSPHLGLIIVDEEHESSFKQEEAPRYNGRDAAVYRGKEEGIPVLLGSATPSVESYYNAVHLKKYRLHILKERYDTAVLPRVTIVDMRSDSCESGKTYPFSREMLNQLRKRKERGEQSILFMNRKGYHTALICSQCGTPLECRHCSHLLTYYKGRHVLQCHLCSSHFSREDVRCSQCGGNIFTESGMGTEKIDERVKELLPELTVMRIDGSTVGRHDTAKALFREFEKGGADILIGTQMVAKGIDFENVTFVGVLSADAMMNLPDFRANERTFQLISQVCGRSGRGKKEGEALIQTWMPHHYVLQSALAHDYEAFFASELAFRKELGYPPFTRICRIIFENREKSVLEKECKELEKQLERISGPAVTAIFQVFEKTPRRSDFYRAFLLLRSSELRELRRAVFSVKERCRKMKSRILVDMDPAYLGL